LFVQRFEEIQTRFIIFAQQAGRATVWIVYGCVGELLCQIIISS